MDLSHWLKIEMDVNDVINAACLLREAIDKGVYDDTEKAQELHEKYDKYLDEWKDRVYLEARELSKWALEKAHEKECNTKTSG